MILAFFVWCNSPKLPSACFGLGIGTTVQYIFHLFNVSVLFARCLFQYAVRIISWHTELSAKRVSLVPGTAGCGRLLLLRLLLICVFFDNDSHSAERLKGQGKSIRLVRFFFCFQIIILVLYIKALMHFMLNDIGSDVFCGHPYLFLHFLRIHFATWNACNGHFAIKIHAAEALVLVGIGAAWSPEIILIRGRSIERYAVGIKEWFVIFLVLRWRRWARWWWRWDAMVSRP